MKFRKRRGLRDYCAQNETAGTAKTAMLLHIAVFAIEKLSRLRQNPFSHVHFEKLYQLL